MSAAGPRPTAPQDLKSLVRDKETEAIRLLGEICDLRRELEARTIDDYTVGLEDGPRPLSSLLTAHAQLLLIHNMGVDCAYCTAYADGISGVYPQLQDRVHVLLVSNDPLERLAGFARERGWRFPVGSIAATSLSPDLGFEPAPQELWPGICAIGLHDGSLALENRYCFEPGDSFSPFWPLQTFLGHDDWEPTRG